MFFNPIKKEINRLRKEINSLLSKGMSILYLKVTIEKNWRSQNFDFLSLKNLSPGQFLEISKNWISKLLNFKTSCYNLKIRRLGAKQWVGFLLLLFWKDVWCFKVKESMHFVEKNINFNKKETESKMENPTHSFRKTRLVLQLI